MSEDYQDKKDRTWTRLNAVRHFFFGVLLTLLAIYVLQNHRIANIEFGPAGSYLVGIVLVVYGLFRIWRGFIDLRSQGGEE